MGITNPFNEKIATSERKLKSLNEDFQNLAAKIDWYENFDETQHQQMFYDVTKAIEEIAQHIKQQHGKVSDLEEKLLEQRAQKAPIWRLKSYLSAEQKQVRQKFKELTTHFEKTNENLTESETKRADLRRSAHRLTDELHQFKKLELDELIAQKEELKKRTSEAQRQLSALQAQQVNFESKIKCERDELTRIEKEIESISVEEKELGKIERRLKRAENGYERKKIHEECERRFGEGSPSNLYRRLNSKKAQLKRSQTKLETRIKDVSVRLVREIDTVLFDGNNLCYANGDFIGIDALIKLAEQCSKKFTTIVVFDAGIRGLMKSDDDHIRKRFRKSIEVHIVATKETADETILKYCDDKKNIYVVTNDRYQEYPNSKIVKNKLMLRHEIMGSSAFVHDLDLRISY